MNAEFLSRAECNVLRGIAIIGIFLHNYCHWLGPMVKENEYQFFRSNVTGLNGVLVSPDASLPAHLLSFFGHYGVPVFLFLSAYGLVMKYEDGLGLPEGERRVEPNAFDFVRYHFLKLFKMMIVGFVAFTMLDQITPGAHHYAAMDVVAQLGMFNNVLPHPDKIIWPGPYWFFGLMLQLYLVYRLFLYRKKTWVTVVLMAVCVLLQLFLDPEGEAMNRYRYNFMGGMLPFGLGLLMGRYQQQIMAWRERHNARQTDGIILIFSVLLSYFLSMSFIGWTFVPVFICTGAVAMGKLLPRTLAHWLEWMGGISAALFVCHPITRKIFIPISRGGDLYAGLLLYIVASVCLAWLFKQLMRKIPNPKM
ncbi:MAG: acyltransferase [Prevotella sp.]|nr:acyltransferase [Prevotella sp.]